MNSIKSINKVFLWTVIAAIAGSYIFQFLDLIRFGYYLSLLFTQFIIVIPTAVYMIKSKLSVRKMFRFHKIKIGTVLLLILFAYLIMPLMQEVNLISMLFTKNVITDKMKDITANRPFLFSLFLIAGIPALLEESVYRGSFFNTYRKQSPKRGVFLSGLLFGMMHLNFNQFCYAFLMGCIFCFLIEATDSIVSSMIVHFIINGSSVVMLYLLPAIAKFYSGFTGSSEIQQQMTDANYMTPSRLAWYIVFYGVVAIFTTTLAVLVYIALASHQGRWNYIKGLFKRDQKGTETEKQKLTTYPLVVGMAICVCCMLLNEFV